MVVIAAIGIICVIYFMLIAPQYEKNRVIARDTVAARKELKSIKELILKREANANTLKQMMLQLDKAETDVATGDVYSWTFDTIRQFKAKYPLEIPGIGQPVIGPVDLIGEMPYKQVKATLTGTGYYHDIGKFIADFENNFPHIRIINLSMSPVAGPPGIIVEKVNFQMDVVALIKPNS